MPPHSGPRSAYMRVLLLFGFCPTAVIAPKGLMSFAAAKLLEEGAKLIASPTGHAQYSQGAQGGGSSSASNVGRATATAAAAVAALVAANILARGRTEHQDSTGGNL
eukprot:341437-Pleurochrysis_carterae.AAC.1